MVKGFLSRFVPGSKKDKENVKIGLDPSFLVPNVVPTYSTNKGHSPASSISANSRIDLAAELPPFPIDIQRSRSPDESRHTFLRPSKDARKLNCSSTSTRNRAAAWDLWALARDNLTPKEQKKIEILMPVAIANKHSDQYRLFLRELSSMVDKYRSSQWRHERRDGSRVVFRNMMDKVLVWADSLQEIGNSLAGMDPTGHTTAVLGGLKYIVTAAIKNVAIRELVFDVESISKSIKRCRIFETLYRLGTMDSMTDAKKELKEAQIKLYYQIYVYLIAALEYMHQASWEHAITALGPRDPVTAAFNAIQSADKKVRDWAALVDKEDSADASHKLDEVRSNQLELLKKIGRPILATADTVGFINDQAHAQRQEKILDWVSTILAGDRHLAVQRQRKDDTGDWLLRHEIYQNWKLATHSSSLWIYGKAGYGKSILTSKMIDDIECSHEELKTQPFVFPNPNPDRLAYYYCDKANNATELEDILEIKRCLLRQLSTIEGYPLLRSIVEKFESIHERRHVSDTECIDLMVNLCDFFPSTTLLIDGMDECNIEVRESLLHYLQEIKLRSRGVIKILITSRFEGDIEYALKDVDHRIGLQAADNEGDIRLFIVDQVKRSIGRGLPRTLTTSQQKKVMEILIGKADGMFRWVQLSLAALRKHKTPQDVMENVGLLPPGLNPIYAQIMDEINSFSRHTLDSVQKTINLLLYQQSRTKVDEFIGFIMPGIRKDELKATAIDIVDACRHFVEIQGSAVCGYFRLAHASVQEYLVDVYSKNRSQLEYLPAHGNATIFQMCIEFLQIMDSMGGYRPGTDYAQSFWPYHLAECVGLQQQNPFLQSFMKSCQVTANVPAWFERWIQTTRFPRLGAGRSTSREHNYEIQYAASHSPTPTTIFLACAFGFGNLLGDVTLFPLDLLRLKNIWGESPLTVAIEYGHLEIASLLIGKIEQSKPTNQDFNEWRQAEFIRALCYAAKCERLEILDLLAKTDADVNEKGLDGLAPVQLAASNGREKALRKLVDEYEADTSVVDKKGNSVLVQAIARNHCDCAGLLLTKMEDLNVRNKVGYGPLHMAVSIGSSQIVEMLLGKNVDIDAKNNLDETPIHVACARNSLQIVELLIDHGAMIESQDIDGKTPLHVAAEYGKVDIVQYLVDRGSNTEAQDERGMRPLHYAVISSQAAVGILIDAGANTKARTKDGETPCQLASRMARTVDPRLIF